MAGIDDIYDPSDVSRQLKEIGEERRRIKESRVKARESTWEIGKGALSWWDTEQAKRTQEFLDLRDPIYKMDPDYMEKGFVGRFFTPAKSRVAIKYSGTKAVDPSGTVPKTLKERLGSPLIGKVAGGIGALTSGYDLATRYEEMNDIERITGIASTGLGIASLLGAPGLGLWSLGTSLLRAFGKKFG